MAKRKASQAGAEATASQINPRHKKFARLYARHGNATACYLKVYPNVTYESARTLASQLLTNVDVSDYVESVRERDRLAADFTRDEAIRLLAALARKGRPDAIESLWTKLGLGEGSSKGNWFDGFERLAELVSKSKGGKG